MTFLSWPTAAVAAAIAIPALIILYFLKLRRRDVEVSSTLLWKKAIQDLQANAPFQKLRRNILLLLQLIVLCLILLAVADPQFRDTGRTNRRHILIIDRSASMSSLDGAADGGAPLTRLEAGKRAALRIVESLREPGLLDESGEEAMVIAFDTVAEVRQTFTSNKAELRAAIDRITPTDSPTSLERAYALASAYTGSEKFEEERGFVPVGPGATLHILSDGRLPDAERVRTSPVDSVVYHAVGDPKSVNIGITNIRATRAFDDPNKLSIFVELQSTAPEPLTVDVELAIDGNVVQARGINVAGATPPPPTAEEDAARAPTPGLGGFVFPLERSQGGVGLARIVVPAGVVDALPADNTAYFVFPPARRLSVAVVSEGNYWLQRALTSLSLSRVEFLTLAEFQRQLDEGRTAQYDVVVFDKVLPMVNPAVLAALPGVDAAPTVPAAAGGGGSAQPARGARVRGLPPGRSLVLGVVPPPPLGAKTVGEFDQAVIADWEKDHPALTLSGIGNVALGKGPRLELVPDTPVRAIVMGDKGPVMLEVLDAVTHAVVVAFDPNATYWPLEAGWVLFLGDVLTYLGEANTGGAAGSQIGTGTTLSTRLPVGSREIRLVLPSGERIDLEAGPDGTIAFGPVNSTGLYTVSWRGQATALDTERDGRAVRVLAANLADALESDTTPLPRLALAREVVSAEDADRLSDLTRRLWPYLLLAALGVIMLEWFVYNRKVSL
ncbi:MAG: VWA domain-containing protein [Phycisphaeraceae bacterium]|nr:VWA domain-containing protein [Phycisphaeraceae bacterium]